jgi:outer membrane biosynthesis protein TonB
MTESVTDIIVARERRREPMTRYFVMSLVGHAVVFTLVILMSVTAETAPPPKVFMVTIAGGDGPKTGGMNNIGGRRIERVAPPEPKAVEPPPAATPPKMTLPEPKARPKPQPRNEKTPPKAETAIPAPPTAGAEIQKGSSTTDTGAKGVGFGLSSGGGGLGSAIQTDVSDFCCPEYLTDVFERIRRHWNDKAATRGISVIRFTILRDGTVRDVGVYRSGGANLDFAAERAVQLAPLPRLPGQFREEALGVRLTFNYEQR